MHIILATHNDHKVKEINAVAKSSNIKFVSLKEIGWSEEIPEDGTTIEENAWIKAEVVYKVKKSPVMAEDTGLLIDALNGEPGVHTARFAGPQKYPDDNMNKVLRLLEDSDNRTAQFKTVIALIIDDARHQFTGICKGRIGLEKRGTGGFGYDPIFVPDGYDQSFGELADRIKDKISHRAKAVEAVMRYFHSRK